MAHDPLYREQGRPQTGRPQARLLTALVGLLGLVFTGTALGYGFGVSPSSTLVTFGSMGSVAAPVAKMMNSQPIAAPEVAGITVTADPSAHLTSTLDTAPKATPMLSTLSPESTVDLFYGLLAEQRYADLRQMVTGPIYASLPDASTLEDRTPSGSLIVERAELISLDQSGTTAVVAVDVVEQVALGAEFARHYTGTWTLVLGPTGWLLSDSNLYVG